MGTLAREAEIGVCPSTGVASLGARRYEPWKNLDTVYAKSCNIVYFGHKMASNAVHNAFLNTLTMATLLPCIRQLFNNGDGVSHRNDP